MQWKQAFVANLSFALWILITPASAQAYIGPGAGITAIGTVIALIGAIVLAIVGFVWYPVKRIMKKKKKKTKEVNRDEDSVDLDSS